MKTPEESLLTPPGSLLWDPLGVSGGIPEGSWWRSLRDVDSLRKGKTKLLKYDSPEQWERILSPTHILCRYRLSPVPAEYIIIYAGLLSVRIM